MLSLLGRAWSALPSLFSEPEPEAPEAGAKGRSPKKSPAKAPKPAPKAATPASAARAGKGTPGTGKARREAKRDNLTSEDSSAYSVELRMDGDKTVAVWSHTACRPGDVDAWIGLHAILGDDHEDEVTHNVGSLVVSGRLLYKAVRARKLEGETSFPINPERLEDGQYILALHNAGGGRVGDENLFLSTSDPFTVKGTKLLSVKSGAKSPLKRAKK